MRVISREEFNAEMTERDRQLNEWRASANADLDDMRRVLNETRDLVRETQELTRNNTALIKDNAGSLNALWREYFNHTDDRHGGLAPDDH